MLRLLSNRRAALTKLTVAVGAACVTAGSGAESSGEVAVSSSGASVTWDAMGFNGALTAGAPASTASFDFGQAVRENTRSAPADT
jgi:hypothetical protein